MIDEKDFEVIEKRLDLRYKLISDCNSEMEEVRKEHTAMYVDIASIKKSVESLTWLARTTLGAVIAAIVGLVVAIIK